MAMMRTMTAIQMISDGNGDNEISNDDNDDSDSNDKDYVHTRQSFDIIRGLKGRWTAPRKAEKVYPSLPKFTLADHKSGLTALCPHRTVQKGPKRFPVEEF